MITTKAVNYSLEEFAAAANNYMQFKVAQKELSAADEI